MALNGPSEKSLVLAVCLLRCMGDYEGRAPLDLIDWFGFSHVRTLRHFLVETGGKSLHKGAFGEKLVQTGCLVS